MSATKMGVPPAPDENLVGKTLVPETYHVERKIGAGGMGEVYLVREPSCGAQFAVKRLGSGVHVSPAMQARIAEEGRRLARLNHPNVVKVVKTFRTEAGMFLVMEYVDGESLDAVIDRNGPLPFEYAQEVMEQILVAIAACHDIGIVHRDIKPENVMVSEVGFRTYAKVMDFGIAKLREPDPGNVADNLTREGAVFGSPEYMGPELWGGGAADARTDVYALGVLFYTLLAGRPPFSLREVAKIDGIVVPYQKVALMHVSDKVPDPRFFRPEIPIRLVEVAFRALEKEPKDRYQTVDEMRRAMHAAFAELGMAPQRQSVLGSDPGPRSAAFKVSDSRAETVLPDGSKPVSRHPPASALRDSGTKSGIVPVPDEPPPKRRRGFLTGIVVVGAIGAVAIGGVLLGMKYRPTAPATVTGSIAPAVKSGVAPAASAPAVTVRAIAPAASASAAPPKPTGSLSPEEDRSVKACLASIRREPGGTCKPLCTACEGGFKHSFCESACKLAAQGR